MTEDGPAREAAAPPPRPPRPEMLPPEPEPDGGAHREPAIAEAAPARKPGFRLRPPLLGAGIAAAVLAGGAILWGLDGGSASRSEPRYAALPDACSVLSRGTLDRFAPRAAALRPPGREAAAGERLGVCEWKERPASGPDGTLSAYRFEVEMRLMLDRDGTDATALAGSAYESEWRAALSGAGKATGGPVRLELDRPFPLKGFGDEAFARPTRSDGSFTRIGKVAVTVRDGNVLVTVGYVHAVHPADEQDGKDGGARPAGSATARTGAEAAAREALAALTACSSCRS
ncbi:hypothetical protein [Actinomadura sp. 21ATH]|uniref:hypothetical protein n=1 Tax=Actinomadura sp. 21ATH TaxID=1735444 RepID=UPI0035C073E1